MDKLINYQPDVIKLLNNSFKKNRLVHTYLFHGNKGTMKMETALYFASKVLCKNNIPCEECKECKSIRNGTNPNVFIVRPEGEYIKKEQIINLEHEFSLTSEEKRIFIIEHIDKATSASANSLLKFLEDSGPNCYGILITENINMVLPTIKSRSQVIAFVPTNKKFIYDMLLEKGVGEENSSIISTLTNDHEEALLLTNDKILNKVIELVKSIGMSFESTETDSIIIMNEQGKFLMSEGSRVYHNYFIDLLTTFQSDKIKYLLGENNSIVFKSLEKNKLNLNMEAQIKILEIVMALKSKIKYNINVDLAYFQMLIEVKRC